jgi:hypothetical protein
MILFRGGPPGGDRTTGETTRRASPMPKSKALPVIGWREWIALPELGIAAVKAKVDTGARSSALHAFDVETVRRKGREFARFKVHPRQRSTKRTIHAEAEVIDHRVVKNSGGQRTLRPVIETLVDFQGARWPIELTLVGRDEMGFRMLLGRHAIRRRFLVDSGRSFVGGHPRRRPKRG